MEVGEGGEQLHHVAAHARLRVGGRLTQPHKQGLPAHPAIVKYLFVQYGSPPDLFLYINLVDNGCSARDWE